MRRSAVVLVTAAASAIAIGAWWHGLELRPGWATMGWLVAVTVTGQLLGWLLVAYFTSRLPSEVGSALLLLTPVGAVLLGIMALAERPSMPQLAGCALILVAGYAGTASTRGQDAERTA